MYKGLRILFFCLPIMLLTELWSYERYNPTVITTFIVIYYISVSEYLKKSNYLITLKDFFFLFVLIFFCLVPFFQYSLGINVWNFKDYSDSSYIKGNFIIILFLLTYKLIYFLVKKPFKVGSKVNLKRSSVYKLNFLMILISLFLVYKYGFFNLFIARNQFEELKLNSNNTIHNLIEMFSRTVIFFTVVNNIMFSRYSKKIISKILLVLSVIIMLLLINPLNIPRYLVVTFYLPLILIVINPYKKREWFKVSFIFAVLILFPFLGMIRRDFTVTNLDFITTILSTGSFDSHSMLVQGVEYYSFHDLSYGYQLLGSMLFFIPRFFWTTKPVGTGEHIADELFFDFTNVSFPFVGEGYANFGYIGVVIFAIALSYVHKRMDLSFWGQRKFNFSVEHIYYLCFLGLTFFIMRGDFLSSFAYSTSIFLILKMLKTTL